MQYITSWVRTRMPEFGGKSAGPADRVLAVLAETGSGKSTTLPVAVFRILRSERTPAAQRFRGGGVVCTQPRVLTAVALARDVSSRPWNPDMVLGTTVGYQTGPTANRPPSGLLYVTAGVLDAQLQNWTDDEVMDRYRVIIVDEAHERTLDCDVTMMLLRNFYERNAGNQRLPFLLLTSATFDAARYAAYFGVGAGNIVEVVGRAYPIEVRWPAQGTNNYPAEAAAVALRVHAENPDDPPEQADILVFMPGAAETSAAAAILRAAKPARPFLVLVINREVVASQAGDYLLVFERPDRLPGRPARRIVISTVVAETGLTIDTLRYVIDCGWSRSREVYQPWRAEGLITRPAPRSRIKQRQGRAGRLFPGVFLPLYTKKVYEALEEQQLPDIVTIGAGELLLAAVRDQQHQKLRLGRVPEFRVEDLALLDPPPPEAFLAAAAAAAALGFVSPAAALPDRWPPAELADARPAPAGAPRGYGLTALGHLGAALARATMAGARVLLAGYVWGAAASDLITAVAMFGTAPADLLLRRGPPGALAPGAEALRAALPPFLGHRVGGAAGARPLPPTESETFFFRARLVLADEFAEAVLVFDAFARRLDALQGDLSAAAGWCAEVGLDCAAMVELARRRDALAEEMIAAGLDPFRADRRRLSSLPIESFVDGVRALKRCLYDGLRGNLLRLDGDAYVTEQGLRVRAPALFTDATASRLRALGVTASAAGARPRWLVTDRIRLVPVAKSPEDAFPPLLYAAEAGLVSVLDGHVDPDPEFGGAREFPDN